MTHRLLPLFLLLAACDSVETEPDPAELETLPDANPGTDPGPIADAGVTSTTAEAPLIASLHVHDVLTRRAAHQGASAVPVHILGERLAGANVSIDGVVLPIVSFADTELVVTWDVPHGAAIGGRTVLVTSAAGTTTVTNGVEVTAIHVDQGVINGDGTPEAPYAALHTTLAKAEAGDEVRLIGNFEVAKTAPVPAGVHVVGQGADTVLTPGDGFKETGMTLGDGASLYGVKLGGFGTCLAVSRGSATIAKVSIDNCGTGLYLSADAVVDASDLELSGCSQAGIVVDDAKSVTLRRMKLVRTGKVGVQLLGGALSIEDSQLTHIIPVSIDPPLPLYWDARPISVPAGRPMSFTNVEMGVGNGVYKGPLVVNPNLRIEEKGNSVTLESTLPK